MTVVTATLALGCAFFYSEGVLAQIILTSGCHRYLVVQMDCSSQFHSLPSAQLGVILIAQPNVVSMD